MVHEFPEEWQIFPIPKNTKKTNRSWKKYQERENRFPREELYQHLEADGNCCIITGRASAIGDSILLIIDFDGVNIKSFKEIFKTFKKTYPKLSNTLIQKTPSGGIHLYYYYKDGELRNEKYSNMRFDCIEHIDTRAEGGYALIEPSIINGKKYKVIKAANIVTINKEDHNNVINFFVKTEEAEKPVRRKQKMFETFAKFLNGEYEFESYAKEENINEHLLWKYTTLDAMFKKNKSKEEVMNILEKTQPSFDRKKFLAQIPSNITGHKPMTKKKYNELFSDKKEDIGKLIDELDVSNNKQLVYITKLVNLQTGVLKGKYLEQLKKKTKIAKKYLETTKSKDIINIYHEIETDLKNKIDIVTFKEELLNKVDNAYTNNIDVLLKYLNVLAKKYKTSYRAVRGDILGSLKDSTIIDMKFFDYDSWVLNFKNGYYDFRINKFITAKDCDKEFIFAINRDYKKNGPDCKKFKDALKGWLTGNDLIKQDDIFEFMAYSLMFGNFLKAFFLNVGDTNTGKTQIMEILKAFVPPNNRLQVSMQRLTSDKFGSWGLSNKILCYYDDMSDSTISDVSMIKSITSGSSEISIEAKHGKKEDMKNTAKIWQNGNYIPKIANSNDVAYLDRVVIMEFFNKIDRYSKEHTEQFHLTITDDIDEMDGIIGELIKAGKRLYKRGNFRREIKDYSKKYYVYKSNEIVACIKDNFKKDINSSVDFDEFKDLVNNIRNKRGKPMYTSNELGKILEREGYFKKWKMVEGERFYVIEGLDWKNPSKEKTFMDNYLN